MGSVCERYRLYDGLNFKGANKINYGKDNRSYRQEFN